MKPNRSEDKPVSIWFYYSVCFPETRKPSSLIQKSRYDSMQDSYTTEAKWKSLRAIKPNVCYASMTSSNMMMILTP